MFIKALLTNYIVLSVLVSTVICQSWKIIDHSIRLKKVDWDAFTATGGMPSSHATFVCSLATSIGMIEGFISSLFFIAAGFAMIVLRDAIGVRRTVDDVSGVVNAIIKIKHISVHEIAKIAGHTPVQVLIGSVIGILVPIGMKFWLVW